MGTRDRLLEAAIRLLHENGYARTTTRQIVDAADAHLPSVNYFFGSKEKLMDEAVEAALRRWTVEAIKAADAVDAAHPRERVRVGLTRFMATLQADRGCAVAAVEAFAQAERSDDLREQLAQAYREFRDMVARAASGDTAEVPSAELNDLASVLIALFDGLAIQWVLSADDTPGVDSIMGSLDLLAQLLHDRAPAENA